MSGREASRVARAAERVRRSRGGLLKVAIPTAAVLGAGAAVAVGAIPGSNGTITACYVTGDPAAPTRIPSNYGALRVIDPSSATPGVTTPKDACAPTETTITWNQTGPQGLPGPQGAQGGQGPVGTRGPQGAQGTSLIGDTSFAFGGGGTTFLKLDGVSGESKDSKHKGDIELTSFSFGVSAGSGANGSGAGAGKRTFQSFQIVKQIDKASPALFKGANTGHHYKEAVIELARKAKGKKGTQDFLEFKFSDVIISTINAGVSGNKPSEEVTFKYDRAAEQLIGSNGKVQATVKVQVNSKG